MNPDMKLNGKVFVIGLDGATLDLINPWIDEGKLPNFAQLKRDGITGKLRSTIPHQTPIAWTSFMTGMNAGKHGIFDFMAHDPNSYDIKYINAEYRRTQPFWSTVSNSGGKVGVVNVPMTYPPDKVDGIMISGMDAPGTDVPFTHPSGLYKELKEEFGEYTIDTPIYPRNKIHDWKYVNEVIKLTEFREKITLHLMKKYPWDLFVVVFVGPDRVQHDFWGYTDSLHPDFHSRKNQELRNAIFTIYSRLDGVLGKIFKELDEDVHVIIMSDHGAGPSYKLVILNDWLEKQGYLKYIGGLKQKRKDALGKLGGRIFEFKQLMPQELKRTVKKIIRPKKPFLIDNLELSLDWSGTQAYSEGTVGNIFLNILGKHPQGIVEPGREYEALRDKIIAELSELRDPETGKKVIDSVYRREDIFHGGCLDTFPDLIVVPREGYRCIGNLKRFNVSSKEGGLFMRDFWSGDHRPDGTVMMKGPHIKKDVAIQNARIIDIAPTVLYLLGLPISEEMDGEVLGTAIVSDHLKNQPPRFTSTQPYDAAAERGGKGYTEEDEEKVREKLRSLGYIE